MTSNTSLISSEVRSIADASTPSFILCVFVLPAKGVMPKLCATLNKICAGVHCLSWAKFLTAEFLSKEGDPDNVPNDLRLRHVIVYMNR